LKGEYFENPECIQNIKNQNNIRKGSEIEVAQTEISTAAEQLNIGNVTKIDRLFLSFGMELTNDKILPLFSKGTQLPASFEGTFPTGHDNQTEISFSFCEGERIRFSKNFQLGGFRGKITSKLT
jgi:molecular chaperone DnaK (HSP70)